MCSSTTTRPRSVSMPAAVGKSTVGPHAGSGDDEFGLDDGAGVQHDLAVPDGGHARRADEPNADVGQHLRDALTDLEAESAPDGHRLRRDESRRDTALGQTGRRLTSDQAAADHDGGVGVLGGHPQDDGVGERPQGQRRLPAGNGERDRCRAGGQHEMPVRVAPACCGDDFAVGEVDVVDGDAAVQLDALLDEPARAVQVELGVPAAEIGLAERWLGVRQRGVAGEDVDGNLRVLLAKRLRSGQPCRTTADGDETRCHHTFWLPPPAALLLQPVALLSQSVRRRWA